MKVNIYDADGTTPMNEGGPPELREVCGDDLDAFREGLAELVRTGRWWTGGGAAPLVLITRITPATLDDLATAARPLDDEDWGSDTQIEAENDFFEAVSKVLDPAAMCGLEDYCHKATTNEMIDEALRLTGEGGSMAARLFYVRAESTGDGSNMDLFVLAITEVAAADEWSKYYDGWDKPEYVTIYCLAGYALPGAIPWNVIPETTIKVSEPIG